MSVIAYLSDGILIGENLGDNNCLSFHLHSACVTNLVLLYDR